MSETIEVNAPEVVGRYLIETTPIDTARKAFFAAMAKAQAKIEGALKDKNNPAFRSTYADLGAVLDACREPLTSNGISFLQFPDYNPETGCVTIETTLAHVEGYERSFRLTIPVAKRDAQGIGSAITYGRRYSLMAGVGIAPEDDDGNAAVDAAATKKASANSLKKSGEWDRFREKLVAFADPMACIEWMEKARGSMAHWPAAWVESAEEEFNKHVTYLSDKELLAQAT